MSTLSGGACEDSVFERLRFKTTAGAGGIGIRGPPGRVGSQVGLAGSRLVDPPCYKLAQAHKGPRVHGGGVVVIPWCREEAWPLRKEGLPDSLFQGGVGVIHQGPRKDGRGWRDEMRIDHGYPRQPVGKRDGFVSHRVYRQMVPQGGDWSWGLPVDGEIHRRESPCQGP